MSEHDHSQTAVFLTARWMNLLMLNFEIDDPMALLGDRLPVGTELDDWRGRHLVSMVGFQFLDTRVLGLPIPFHRHFDEVNLRFYVKRKSREGNWRRGVVFVKEIVPRRAISMIARWRYNENYVTFPMRHEISEGASFLYEWKREGRWQGISAIVEGQPFFPDHDTEEWFITEHYWGYTRQRDGSTMEYRVAHPPWKVWRASAHRCSFDVRALYGQVFESTLTREPSSIFVADGSEVMVHRGSRLMPTKHG